MFIGELKSQL